MPSPSSPAARAQELADRLRELRDAYYRGEPLVVDADYDALEDELRALLAEHPDAAPADNPLDRVGAPAVLHAPVRHARPMLSLDKATTAEQVEAFTARFPGQRVAVTPKLDGLSLSCVYEGGRLRTVATRGDGTTGEDVTPLAVALVDDLPSRVDGGGRVEVRGEAVMLRSTFDAYNAAHPDKPLINPRNAAAGTLRAKRPEQVAERRLRFFAFDVDGLGEADYAETMDALRAQGFHVTPVEESAEVARVLEALAAIEASRPQLDYDIDGAVVRLADRRAYAAAGVRSASPRGALAFKFAAEERTTTLEDVVWDVGKIGKVAPVAVLAPVHVGGTTVTRATLANQAVIRARDVKIGDTVLVRRAGDVIPFVQGVLDPATRTGRERDVVAPTHCPSCATELVVQGASQELFCPNLTCPAQTVRRLIHWASRAAADIEAVGPVWIERLNDAGLLGTPSDFYALTFEQLLAFEGIGQVSAERMVASIDASRGVGLRRALIGFAIPMVGEGTAARLCRAGFRSLEEVAEASEEALQAVEDIGPKVAASLHEHLNRPAAVAERTRLRELGVDLDVREEDLPVQAEGDAPLAGLTVVITGAISDPRSGEKVARPAFAKLAERAGATVASSVSASTDWLIAGADVGAAKTQKAEKLGVRVVDQGEVWERLVEAGIA